MKPSSLFILAATLLSQAQAQTTFGGTDCGKWINEPTPHKKSWLVGYLSGMNVSYDYFEKKDARNALEALTSVDQAFLWMDKWCKENPLKNVGEGGISLFYELRTLRDQRKK